MKNLVFALLLTIPTTQIIGNFTANKIVGGHKPAKCNAGPPADVWVDTATPASPVLNVCGTSGWVAITGGGGGSPAGPDTSVQIDNAGSFGSATGFTFAASKLTVPNMLDSGLAGGGTLCVHADNVGNLGVAAADCGSGGSSVVQQATVTLTNAQILALPTTPVTLIPAIANKLIVPLWSVFRLDNWAANYTNITGTSNLQIFTGGTFFSSISESVNSDVSALLANGENSSAFVSLYQQPGSGQTFGWGGTTDANLVGQDCILQAGNTGNFTGGNPANTLNITVYYVVVSQ